MDKGLYQYDPETKEFKLRRNRRLWPGETDETAEPRQSLPEAGEAEADAERGRPLRDAGPSDSPDPEDAHSISQAGAPPSLGAAPRVKRRRRGPSPYLPQEADSPVSDLMRRLIWIFIFIMLVAWVLMIAPLMNRIQTEEQRLFREDGNGSVFPRL